MEFVTNGTEDLETIFGLYDKAIEFQKQVFDKHWLGFDRELIEREIAEGRSWKLVEDGRSACIFSVAYEDPVIWGKNSGEGAMYIHRIVTNPEFRGRGYVKSITEWARRHARAKGLRYIRMDTWGDNQKLIDYYTNCGFSFLGVVAPDFPDDMPKHYDGISLSLFEIDMQTV